jgi:hypothetical protein
VRRLVVTALAALLVASGCGTSPSPSGSAAGPIGGRTVDGLFVLELVVGKAVYAAGEPIEAAATLRYGGPEGAIEAYGSGGGLIGFGVEHLDGQLGMGPGFEADCATHQLRPSVTERFSKSGGFSPDDPHADWIRAYFADPLLRLPAGSWRVFAVADFMATPGQPGLGCSGEQHSLTVDVRIEVR